MEGFPDEDKEIMRITNEFSRARNQNSKQKEMMKTRALNVRKINRLFGRLGNECFGSAFKTEITSPDSASKSSASSSKKSEKTDKNTKNDDVNKSLGKAFDDEATEDNALFMQETPDPYAHLLDEEDIYPNPIQEDISSSIETAEKNISQKTRPKSSVAKSQEFFETKPEVTSALITKLKQLNFDFADSTIFEPCR